MQQVKRCMHYRDNGALIRIGLIQLKVNWFYSINYIKLYYNGFLRSLKSLSSYVMIEMKILLFIFACEDMQVISSSIFVSNIHYSGVFILNNFFIEIGKAKFRTAYTFLIRVRSSARLRCREMKPSINWITSNTWTRTQSWCCCSYNWYRGLLLSYFSSFSCCNDRSSIRPFLVNYKISKLFITGYYFTISPHNIIEINSGNKFTEHAIFQSWTSRYTSATKQGGSRTMSLTCFRDHTLLQSL